MFTSNPFAALTEFLSPFTIQAYALLMIAAVFVGTLFDAYHKGSAKYFALRKQKANARAERNLDGGERFSLAVATFAEAAVSGEFCKWPRRLSHLLMMYGFILYLVTTLVMVFGYLQAAATPSILPTLWTLGALMILAGGAWFFFFLRVNVAHDGDSPLHVGRADLFILSVLLSIVFALLWHFMQTTYGQTLATRVLFGIYIFFTTFLFLTVPWSKFAHMFYKPTVAYQRRVEEANGSSDLPRPSAENFIVRS
jgi:hypothetical protein